MLLIPTSGRNHVVVSLYAEEGKRRRKIRKEAEEGEVAYLGMVGMPPKSRFAIAHNEYLGKRAKVLICQTNRVERLRG